MLTDLKYNLGNNRLKPAYAESSVTGAEGAVTGWTTYNGGLVEMGSAGSEFVFDNETPVTRYTSNPLCSLTGL